MGLFIWKAAFQREDSQLAVFLAPKHPGPQRPWPFFVNLQWDQWVELGNSELVSDRCLNSNNMVSLANSSDRASECEREVMHIWSLIHSLSPSILGHCDFWRLSPYCPSKRLQPRYRYNRWCRRHWGASCVATWWCWGLAKNRMESRWAEEQSAAVNKLNCLALVYEILWISTIWHQKQNVGIGPGWFPYQYRSWQFCEYLQTTSDSTRVLWKNRIFFSDSHIYILYTVIIFKIAIFCISSRMCIFFNWLLQTHSNHTHRPHCGWHLL